MSYLRATTHQALAVTLLVVGVNLVIDDHGFWGNLIGGGCLGLFAGRAWAK